MLNVTFAGNIYNSNGIQYISDEVKYQCLYYRQSDGYIKWNDVKLSEFGQYNCNLGDSDWLSQDNVYNSGDKVIICFWIDNTKNRNDLTLTEWSFIEIDILSDDVYLNDVQTMGWQNPMCSFSTSGNVILNNIGTTNDQNWLFHNVDQYQAYEKYCEILFDLMSFDINSINIDWGDTNIDTENLQNEYSHTYLDAGDYHIIVKVYNRGNDYCQSEFDVTSDFNIINGLNWIYPVYNNVSSTYTPAISGDTYQIINVDYFIDNVLTYTGLDYNETFNHTFTSYGPHEIKQRILYNSLSGTEYKEETFTIFLESIASFTKEEGYCGPRFVDNSSVGNGPITDYYWGVKYNGNIVAEVNSNDLLEWEYNWANEGTFTVIHKIKDSFGNEFGLERIYNVEKCNSGTGNNGSGGGGGWVQTQYIEKEFPKLKVEKIKEIDEMKLNISIKTTLMR